MKERQGGVSSIHSFKSAYYMIKVSLALNAAAAIFCHNHPSGVAEPSRADEVLTSTLKTALSLVDVRVLDHLIVAGNDVTSFAERGLL